MKVENTTMTQAQQPEALRIAMHLRSRAQISSTPGNLDTLSAAGANELERQHARILELEQGKCLHQIAEPALQHPDDAAADALAALMKAKLAKQREKGYGGWGDKAQCSQQDLSNLLRNHVDKGDPVDVANFCAFLLARGEGITAEGTPLPLLMRDIARDIGISVPEACVALKPWGDYSTNSAVTADMATKLREAFPNPAPQAVQAAVPVAGQSRFKGEKDWQWCSPEHVAMVLATPSEWMGYEVRYLYAHAAEGVTAPNVDAIGAALELESRAKTVESQTTERAMRHAANCLRLLAPATLPAPAIFGDEDHVLVPRGLIGAACSAIDKKRDGTKTLAELRRYTTGDLSAATQPAAQGMDAQDAECLEIGRELYRACDELPWGYEIILYLEQGSGTVHWMDKEGNEHDIGEDGVFSEKIGYAIAAAQAKQGGA